MLQGIDSGTLLSHRESGEVFEDSSHLAIAIALHIDR